MKKLNQTVLAACVAALAFGAVSGEAQADEGMDIAAGVMGGVTINLDADEDSSSIPLGVDGRIGFGVADGIDLVINPAVSAYLLEDGYSAFVFDANVLGQFDLDAVAPYVGAGVGLYMVSPDFDEADTETDIAINVLAGTSIDLDAPVAPFVQAKFSQVLVDPESVSELSVLAGVHYNF